MKTILKAQNINKEYTLGNHNIQRVLKDINLEIKEGEFVSIMGPSGSGKSTLLYNISGMDQVTDGSIVLGNHELTAMSEEKLAKLRLHHMGFIFQQSNLLKNLNLYDNIVLSAYRAKREGTKEINKRALELMKKTGILELAENDITQASGGQLQRASICRALMNNPDIIFGDEPTGALNSKSAGEVMDILGEVNRDGTTILLVTHDAKVAARTERVLFMMDGSIIAEKYLGKYNESTDHKLREQELASWLAENEF